MAKTKNNNRPTGQAESPKNVAGTPVVILFGETGSGKSHFISVAGKPKLSPLPTLGESGSLHACTTSVAPFKVEKSATCVQLVDTPGFNNTKNIPNHEIAGVIIEWLQEEPETTIAGILYLQDTNSPSTPAYKENITKAFPGAQWITWSSVNNENLNSPAGGHSFDNTNDSAWRIITDMLEASKNTKLTRGQLAKKLMGISGYMPPKKSALDTFRGFFRSKN
ncbi:hypothetical protein BJ912DRAFT_981470 [Pholiota molesta]|nr:hypothetical protein BJ912DRAFT_981470 [Pholiota molesta]